MNNIDKKLNKGLAKIYKWAEKRLETIDEEIINAKHYKIIK